MFSICHGWGHREAGHEAMRAHNMLNAVERFREYATVCGFAAKSGENAARIAGCIHDGGRGFTGERWNSRGGQAMNGVYAAFEGRIGRDAEVRSTRDGKPWASFPVAVDARPDGEAPATWVRCGWRCSARL